MNFHPCSLIFSLKKKVFNPELMTPLVMMTLRADVQVKLKTPSFVMQPAPDF